MYAYNVWLSDSSGLCDGPPSTIYGSGLVDAQRRALELLKELQSEGKLKGWSILTVTEAC